MNQIKTMSRQVLLDLHKFYKHFFETEQYDLALKFCTLFLKCLEWSHKNDCLNESDNVLLNIDWENLDQNHLKEAIEHINKITKKSAQPVDNSGDKKRV